MPKLAARFSAALRRPSFWAAGLFLCAVWAGAELPFMLPGPPVALAARSGDDEGDRALAGARAAMQQGDLPSAVTLAQSALRGQPAFAEAALLEAQAWEALGQLGRAQQAYRRVIAMDFETAQAHLGLGRVLEPLRPAEALQEYANARSMSPGAPAPLLATGALLIARGEAALLPEAERLFREALALDPTLVAATVGLAHAQVRRGNPAAAEILLREALARAPASLQANVSLAVLLARAGDLAGARERLAAAGVAAPGDPRLRGALDSLRPVFGQGAAESLGAVWRSSP